MTSSSTSEPRKDILSKSISNLSDLKFNLYKSHSSPDQSDRYIVQECNTLISNIPRSISFDFKTHLAIITHLDNIISRKSRLSPSLPSRKRPLPSVTSHTEPKKKFILASLVKVKKPDASSSQSSSSTPQLCFSGLNLPEFDRILGESLEDEEWSEAKARLQIYTRWMKNEKQLDLENALNTSNHHHSDIIRFCRDVVTVSFCVIDTIYYVISNYEPDRKKGENRVFFEHVYLVTKSCNDFVIRYYNEIVNDFVIRCGEEQSDMHRRELKVDFYKKSTRIITDFWNNSNVNNCEECNDIDMKNVFTRLEKILNVMAKNDVENEKTKMQQRVWIMGKVAMARMVWRFLW